MAIGLLSPQNIGTIDKEIEMKEYKLTQEEVEAKKRAGRRYIKLMWVDLFETFLRLVDKEIEV
jgi:hypothetical protein